MACAHLSRGSNGALRFGEAIALRPMDLDTATAELTVSRSVVELGTRLEIGMPKTRAGTRTLVVPAPLVNELARHIADEGSRRKHCSSAIATVARSVEAGSVGGFSDRLSLPSVSTA